MSDRSQAAAREPVAGRAPGELDKVRAFVNTLDIEQRTDELSSPAALAAWLGRNGLLGSESATGARISDADLDRALTLREALRDVLASHVTPEPVPTADLRSLATSLPTRLEITDDGRVTVAADGSSSDGAAALARILLIAADAATLGTWARLKVCSADDCRWAFYDRSPTRSGHWCSMRICGSRAKSRAYRRRAAPAAAT
jgi:predicted RNA-binding Zn ribbon-like protein